MDSNETVDSTLIVAGIVAAMGAVEELVEQQTAQIAAAIRADLEEAALADKPLRAGFRLAVKLDFDNDPPQVLVTVGYGKARRREAVAEIEAATEPVAEAPTVQEGQA